MPDPFPLFSFSHKEKTLIKTHLEATEYFPYTGCLKSDYCLGTQMMYIKYT